MDDEPDEGTWDEEYQAYLESLGEDEINQLLSEAFDENQ